MVTTERVIYRHCCDDPLNPRVVTHHDHGNRPRRRRSDAGPERYSLAMGEGERGRHGSRALAVMRGAARWQPRSYVQIWVIAAASYLAFVVVFTAFLGWPRAGGIGFVGAATGFACVGAGQSYRLNRRRVG
jgi:hypothetical protein